MHVMSLKLCCRKFTNLCGINSKKFTVAFVTRNVNTTRSLASIYKEMKIGTHDGKFHCDEVLACFMLKRLPQYQDADIIRTRDAAKLAECDIVVDVGAVFDHDKKLYDHHQKEFTETFGTLRPDLGDKYNIRLSSAGLIYTYYGEEIIQSLAPKDHPLSSNDLQLIYKKVYKNLIEEIDAIDNGVPMTDGEQKYQIRTDLSNRISRLFPVWNSKNSASIDDIFKTAMNVVGEEFLYLVNNYIHSWLPARDYVRSALDDRLEYHKSGEILVFKELVPWKEHLFDLELEQGIGQKIKYVIFKDKSWRVQAVPVTPSSFVARKSLLSKWWGIRDSDLSEIVGIPGCVFCHMTGYIGGNATYEGALQMAVASLNG